MSNNKISLVSAESLIGEFLQDYNMNSSDFISRLNRHIVRGIELMDIDTYFNRCYATITIEEGRGVLPCEMKYLEAIFISLGDTPHRIDYSNNDLTALDFMEEDMQIFSDAYIQEGILTIKDYEGDAYVVYRGLPINEKGYVLMPDDAWLMEALGFFLIYKLGISGYKHKVFNIADAEQRWNALYPRARNSVNFPTVQEMQNFTEMWSNPLKGDWFNGLFN